MVAATVAALRAYAGEAEVQTEALRLLANLASSSEGQAVVLDADGVVNAAMAALQAHASETEVQQEALRLLAKASPF